MVLLITNYQNQVSPNLTDCAGYCCGRKCQKDESNVPYADAEYEYFEQRQLPARPIQPGLQPLLQHTDYKRPQDETLYAEPILINHNVNISNPLGN